MQVKCIISFDTGKLILYPLGDICTQKIVDSHMHGRATINYNDVSYMQSCAVEYVIDMYIKFSFYSQPQT